MHYDTQATRLVLLHYYRHAAREFNALPHPGNMASTTLLHAYRTASINALPHPGNTASITTILHACRTESLMHYHTKATRLILLRYYTHAAQPVLMHYQLPHSGNTASITTLLHAGNTASITTLLNAGNAASITTLLHAEIRYIKESMKLPIVNENTGLCAPGHKS